MEQKNEPATTIDDPLIVEYAETLKGELGDAYSEDLDKLSLKERIATMKLIKKSLAKVKPVSLSEGKAPVEPEPALVKPKYKNHIEKYEEGYDFYKNNSRRSPYIIQ